MAGTSTSSRKSSSGTKSKNNKTTGSKVKAGSGPAPIRREVGAVVCAFLGIFSIIGFFHVDALFIALLCGLVKGIIGWGFYLFPPALLMCAFILGFHRGRPVALRVTATLLLPVLMGAILHLLFCKTAFSFDGSFAILLKDLYLQGHAMACGGVLCGLASMGMEAMFSVYGAFPVLLAGFIFLLMISVNLTFAQVGKWFAGRERLEYEAVPEPEPVSVPRVEAQPVQRFAKPIPAGRRAIDIPLDEDAGDIEYEEEKVGFFNRKPRVKAPDQILVESAPCVQPEPEPAPMVKPELEPVREAGFTKQPAKVIREEVEAETAAVSVAIEKAQAAAAEYEFPPIELLRKGTASTMDGREEVALNRERLETTIKSFGVAATIVGVTRGPTVTRYDLELDAGVKLNKLTNLAGDLALSLGVTNVRIAPIPDKISTVGVEVPNKLVSIVYLRDIIESPVFRNAASSLTFAIGKDIGGDPIVGNISKLPHMLIAGTTGSGKSVCLNSLLLSLLYKSTPDEVRLIMIDPKMVELGVYNGIPHLFVPVVTDPKKAAGALQWAVVEMMKRYRLFSEASVRDLTGYNAHQLQNGGQTLPKVVIVVDELADLMLCAAKEVEESICRVAQMGRASGMHLIIATQRPSADVITGLMKANIPSRIAFAVSSAMESRIILDAQGAEKLVGMGDMLYSPLGSGKPVRIQGAYVSDDERENVIDFIKTTAMAEYSDEILAQIEKAAEDKPAQEACADIPAVPENQYDELLPQAMDVIFEVKQASVSMLQRRLKLGYSRAARLIDQMEELGVVGPFEGSKPRQLLITKQQWQEMQANQGTAATERFVTEMEFGTDSDDEDS